MSFVTDEIVAAAARNICASFGYDPDGCDPDTLPEHESLDGWKNWFGFKPEARAALTAAAPLWLAHVRAASEHTADYQMAAAAAELRATTTPAGPASTGGMG